MEINVRQPPARDRALQRPKPRTAPRENPANGASFGCELRWVLPGLCRCDRVDYGLDVVRSAKVSGVTNGKSIPESPLRPEFIDGPLNGPDQIAIRPIRNN